MPRTILLGNTGSPHTRFLFLLVFFIALAAYIVLFQSYDHSVQTQLFLSKLVERPEVVEQQRRSTTHHEAIPIHGDDEDCIFRDSKLYRKIYVYPSPDDQTLWRHNPSILTDTGRTFQNASFWPWLEIDRTARETASAHYNIESQNVQYASELLIRDLITNSCLRTDDPENAELFYVPYWPSTEHHLGHDRQLNYTTSEFGNAILRILDHGEYEPWERTFGLTSKYWKRRNGSDHILVFSEPMHGLYHPRSKRGHFHFIHTQKQLAPPIVFSVELSTSFVQQYPHCARKNILLPYPNTHGGWFNGQYGNHNRTISQYYSAGMHGTCTKLRRAMKADYNNCAPSFRQLKQQNAMANAIGMRKTLFCPCPGGDSPSAKRMFDSLIAGCIPIILSKDFVWPFTNEFDPNLELDPQTFSLRLSASDYDTALLDAKSCQPVDPDKPGLQTLLDNIPPEQIRSLQEGVAKAGRLFSWYKEDPNLPLNPLREGIVPNGGTAHFVVRALEERAAGRLWPACRDELAAMPERRPEPRKFEC